MTFAATIAAPFKVASPSLATSSVLQPMLARERIAAAPLAAAAADAAVSAAFQAIDDLDLAPSELLKEQSVYALAVSFTPAWIAVLQPEQTDKGVRKEKEATSVFLGGGAASQAAILGLRLPWRCRPEIHTYVDESNLFHVPFCGEVMSVRSAEKGASQLYDQLLTHCTLATAASLFRNVPAGRLRFFAAAPVAYGLACFAHVGYLLRFEWNGKWFSSVASEPFFLGSARHSAAILSIVDHDYSADVVDVGISGGVAFVVGPGMGAFSSAGEAGAAAAGAAAAGAAAAGAAGPPPGDLNRVTWSVEPATIWRGAPGQAAQREERDVFYKIIDAGAYGDSYFRRAMVAYTALAEARTAAAAADSPFPAALLSAQLLYGAARLCIVMPFVTGRDAELAELEIGGCAVAPIAEALVWLARRGLLYHDLRPQNVRVMVDCSVRLIDYDDILVLAGPPPRSFLEFKARLEEAVFAAFPCIDGTFLSDEGNARALPAVAAALSAAAWV